MHKKVAIFIIELMQYFDGCTQIKKILRFTLINWKFMYKVLFVQLNWRAGGHTVLTHTAGENEAEWYSRLRHYALGMQWGFSRWIDRCIVG